MGVGAYQVIQDLVPDDAQHFKGLFRRKRIDQHVAMDANKMFGIKNAIFVLYEVFGISGLGHRHMRILTRAFE